MSHSITLIYQIELHNPFQGYLGKKKSNLNMISAFNRVSAEHTKIVSKKPKRFLETFYSFYKCKTFCHQFGVNSSFTTKNPLIDFLVSPNIKKYGIYFTRNKQGLNLKSLTPGILFLKNNKNK